MAPVVQLDDTGCGIACVAALTGRPYRTVKLTAAGLGLHVSDPKLWTETKPLRRLLCHHGLAAGRREERFARWDSLPPTALLAIKWRLGATGPAWHWVVFHRSLSGACVFDSKKTLRTHRRTDFGRMKPRWFIRITPGRAPAD